MHSVGFDEKEDDVLFEWNKEHCYIFGVCDGLGGHLGGEQASFFLSEFLVKEENRADNEREFEMMILAASRMIYCSEEMGFTTLAAAFLQGNQITVIHAGDSRAYLLTENKVQRLTRDHSNLELLKQCFVELTEKECHAHHRYVMNQCVGSKWIQVGKTSYLAKSGDKLLFLTDGAYLSLQEEWEVDDKMTPQEILDLLRAYCINSDDNATAVLIHIE